MAGAGRFDSLDNNLAEVDLQANGEPDDPSGDRAFYLETLRITSSYAGRSQSSETTFFENRPARMTFEGDRWLCRSILSSPFSIHSPEGLAQSYEDAVAEGTKQRVVDFLREHVDAGLRDIDLVDGNNRFRVTHADFERAPDLSSFGEGMQRIFHLGLLFAAAST